VLPPHPLEAIKAMMEMKGMTIADLAPIMPRNRAYEVLSGRRPLNLRMMRGLHELLAIPYDCLMQEYPLKVS
jgi:HTH-type transcriptional regulator/antitoxin HigA